MSETPSGVDAVQMRIAALQRKFTNSPTAAARTGATAAIGDVDFSRLLAELQGGSALSGTALGTPAASTGDMRSASARRQFATDLLRQLGLPQTSENMRAMTAWQQAEGTSASFNPLATTRHAPGATDINEVGVKNFVSYEQGLRATIDTLRNGLYGNILAALRDGTSARRVAQAIADSPWGTGDGVTSVLESGTI